MAFLLVWRTLHFVSGLMGAVVLAAFLSALSVPGAGDGAIPYAMAVLHRLMGMAQFDFGLSDVTGWSAFGVVARALPYTLGLVAMGAVVAILIGVPLGLLLGTGPLRRAAAPLIQIVAAAPVFCAALLLSWVSIRVFSAHPLPPNGALFAGGIDTVAATVFLPVLTVGAAGAAAVQLALRRAASQAQNEPWRMSLRRMGLPAFEIERVYVAPQVFAGLLAHLGEVTLALFSATAVAEWVFGWPGAAALFVKSLAFGDWNVAALVLLLFAAFNFIADLAGTLAGNALIGNEART